MKEVQLKCLLGLMLLLFASSCEKEEAVELLAVDSALRIELTENSREEGPSEITLIFTSLKEYPCLGYTLVAGTATGEHYFSFSFSGVKPPQGGCLTAIGPAMAIVPLGRLANGVYELEISNGDFSGEGTLELKEEEIILDFNGQEGILIPAPRLSR